jgi:hypothetical protein
MDAEYKSHHDAAGELDIIRTGKYEVDGKTKTKAAHVIMTDVREYVVGHLRSRGFLFKAGGHLYYFDQVEHRLIELVRGGSKLTILLTKLHLEACSPATATIEKFLIARADASETREVYRLAYFTGTESYLRRTETSMLKITPATIEEVPLGTDDVFLIADDLADLPVLEELIPHMDRLRASVGTSCTQVLPDLPLAKLTSRWDVKETLSPEQMWQTYFTRMIGARSRSG